MGTGGKLGIDGRRGEGSLWWSGGERDGGNFLLRQRVQPHDNNGKRWVFSFHERAVQHVPHGGQRNGIRELYAGRGCAVSGSSKCDGQSEGWQRWYNDRYGGSERRGPRGE